MSAHRDAFDWDWEAAARAEELRLDIAHEASFAPSTAREIQRSLDLDDCPSCDVLRLAGLHCPNCGAFWRPTPTVAFSNDADVRCCRCGDDGLNYVYFDDPVFCGACITNRSVCEDTCGPARGAQCP